jgi:hypothetical protein
MDTLARHLRFFLLPDTGPVKKYMVSNNTHSGLVLFIPEDRTPTSGKFFHCDSSLKSSESNRYEKRMD